MVCLTIMLVPVLSITPSAYLSTYGSPCIGLIIRTMIRNGNKNYFVGLPLRLVAPPYSEYEIDNVKTPESFRKLPNCAIELQCKLQGSTFWKVLKCPGIVQNVLESPGINEFSGSLGLLNFGMMTVVPFL